VRDPVAAANAGLDLPGLAVTEGRTAEDFTSGRIPARRLDEIVRRTLFAIFDAGLVEHPLPEQRPALASTPEHVALATRIATNGMVLLVNRDSLLPLDAGQVGSVAVIGTARDDAQWVMAGSPCVRVSPDRLVTPPGGNPCAGRCRRAGGVFPGFRWRRGPPGGPGRGPEADWT
jgi:beta-glucosidase